MSYSEQDGQVVLTLSRDDYDLLVQVMGYARGAAIENDGPLMPPRAIVELLNRLNQGNPDFTPYQVGEK